MQSQIEKIRLYKKLEPNLPRVPHPDIPRDQWFTTCGNQDTLGVRYRDMPKRGLRVKAYTQKPFVATMDDTLHFDALIYGAAANSHPCAPIYPHSPVPVVFPLPIELIWVSNKGLPLWAASDLIKSDELIPSVAYWHKRFPQRAVSEHCTSINVPTSRGPYKEYRVNLPLQTAPKNELEWQCIGNPEEIERLLSFVDFVGKKRSQGLGHILKWEVIEDDSVTIESIMSHKDSVPKEFSGESKCGFEKGFTPPYYYVPWHSMC